MSRQHGDDAVLGGWLSREGLGLAYHTPSLIDHVGEVSSVYLGQPDQRNLSNAIDDVSELPRWHPPSSLAGKIGLVGWNTATGLGAMNRDLSAQPQIRKWVIPPHPELENARDPVSQGTKVSHGFHSQADVETWLKPLDWLLFVERPVIDELPRMAAHRGIGIACIPMWEWIQPHHHWLQFVDVMLCPTQLTFDLMDDWKTRYGFGWKTVQFQWPIPSGNFRFQQRSECRRFLFVNGWGGGTPHRLDGSACGYNRKGLELIIAAARLAPDLQFVVCSLAPLPSALPKNIEVRPAFTDFAELYDVGDVCVQPSHYEGLGLQLLECQAAGMPLITTDTRPMNEHHPWKTIPVAEQEVVRVGDGFICSEILRPEDLVTTLRPLVGCDISEFSRQARSNIETHHCWVDKSRLLCRELGQR